MHLRGTPWTLLAALTACASATPPVRSAAPAESEPAPEPAPEPVGPADREAVAAALGVGVADVFAVAPAGAETWAVVRVTHEMSDSPPDEESIEDQCSDQDFDCAIALAGSREAACDRLGCASWQLRLAGTRSTPPIVLTPPVPALDTRVAPELELRDVDGDGRLEVIVSFGVLFGDSDGLWTIALTRIVDSQTGATQGELLRRSENDTYADEGQSSQYHITDQSWRLEGTTLHLHEVVGEGMCDSGSDGPPVARDDDFDPCEVTIRDRVCTYRPPTDDYECRGASVGPLALPRWLASKFR